MANKRQKTKNLAKRVVELEDQLFGQRLLIDELESKIESAIEKITKLENPYGILGNWPPQQQQQQQMQVIRTIPVPGHVDTCINGTSHHYVTDGYGNTICSVCGKDLNISFTYTAGNTTDSCIATDNLVASNIEAFKNIK